MGDDERDETLSPSQADPASRATHPPAPSPSQALDSRRTDQGRSDNSSDGTRAEGGLIPGGPVAEGELPPSSITPGARREAAQAFAPRAPVQSRSPGLAGAAGSSRAGTPFPPQALPRGSMAAPSTGFMPVSGPMPHYGPVPVYGPVPITGPTPVSATSPMPGIWEWDSSVQVQDLIMQDASIWMDPGHRAVEPMGAGTWSPLATDWPPDAEHAAGVDSGHSGHSAYSEGLSALLGQLSGHEVREDDAGRHEASQAAPPPLTLEPANPHAEVHAEVRQEGGVEAALHPAAAQATRPLPSPLLRPGIASVAEGAAGTLPSLGGRVQDHNVAPLIDSSQGGPSPNMGPLVEQAQPQTQAPPQTQAQLGVSAASAILELAAVASADARGLGRPLPAPKPSRVPRVAAGTAPKRRRQSATASDNGAGTLASMGSLIGPTVESTASEARLSSAEPATRSLAASGPGSSSSPDRPSGPRSAFSPGFASGPGSAFGPGSPSGRISSSGPGSTPGLGSASSPGSAPAASGGKKAAAPRRGRGKGPQSLGGSPGRGSPSPRGALARSSFEAVAGGVGEVGEGGRRDAASEEGSSAGRGKGGTSAQGHNDVDPRAEALAGAGDPTPQQEQQQQQGRKQTPRKGQKGRRGAPESRPGGEGEGEGAGAGAGAGPLGGGPAGGRGLRGQLVAKLVVQPGDGAGYSKEADGMKWWKNASKKVTRSDSNEPAKRSYYKCMQCQPKNFEGDELAKKVPEPIQPFPSIFLVRYYGEHSAAPHNDLPAAERVLWENSCASEAGWASLWTEENFVAVTQALLAETGCTQEEASEGASQVGRHLLGRSSR